MTPSARLDLLPYDILLHISTYVDQRTIWAMMGTCRSWREAGKKALKPYLIEQKLIPRPSFLVNPFQSIPSATDPTTSVGRLQSLRERNALFASHLVTLPDAISDLRRLAVELRDRDASTNTSGVGYLRRFLPQLDAAEVHIVEPLPQRAGASTAEDDATVSADSGSTSLWGDYRSILAGTINGCTFPNLTTFTLHTTNRVLEHFFRMSHRMPNLRHLTLGAHWSESDMLNDGLVLGDLGPVPMLSQLESLTIIGGHQTINDVLAVILPPLPFVKEIVIRVLQLPPPLKGYGEPSPDFGQIAFPLDYRGPEHLAVYGHAPFNYFVFVLYRMDPDIAAHVKVLVVERNAEDYTGKSTYPLLNDVDGDIWPLLPRIERIIWIDRKIKSSGAYSLGAFNPTSFIDFYTEKSLRDLFDRYPTLQQVQFIAGHPADPFAEDDPSTWSERNVRCSVDRPGSRNAPLWAARPAIIPRGPSKTS